jgi:hypothetical protein
MKSGIKSHHEIASGVFLHAFARLDPIALGIAIGCWCAVTLLGVTWLLVFHIDSPAMRFFALLAHYLPGFTVTWQGGVLGLLYGFVIGLALGWGFAQVRNFTVRLYIAVAKLKAAFSLLSERLDQ